MPVISSLTRRATAAIGLAILLGTGGRSATAAELPETAPGRLMRQWLQLFNAADAAGLERFFAEHYAVANRQDAEPRRIAAGHLRLRARTGGLDVYATEESSDSTLTVLLATRSILPGFLRGSYAVDPAAPDQVVKSAFAPVATPAAARGSPLGPAALAADLDQKLQQMASRDEFSGAVLIGKDGRTLWQKAYGYRDLDRKLRNDPNTLFRLGSMNKMFTSVAVAQLVEAGKLRFTDTLATILADYPKREVATKISVEQLLTHTSGIPDYFTPEYDRTKNDLRSLRDYLPLFTNAPLDFEPGAQYSYSNSNFIVLGLIIERVSGETYYDYVKRHIYDPAGMKASGTFAKTESVENLATGYTRSEGTLHGNVDTLPWRGTSAGGGHSNVGDLLRFSTALRAHELLGAEMTEFVVTGKVAEDPRDPSFRYAYGFGDSRNGDRRIVGHNGGAPGMSAQLDIYWNEGYTVVVLANLDPPIADQVADYIRDRLQ